MDNPLDRFGLSPFATVEEITSVMRERAEEAPEPERAELREAWEELTMHPRARLRAALFTSPPRSSGARPQRPPPLSPELASAPAPEGGAGFLEGVALVDLLPRPLVAPAFARAKSDAPRVLPRFAEDPIVALVSQPRGAKRT
ncbi:MAG: hypothetical protein U0414_20815 [Polyangiaceae bacterium]